MKEYQQPAKTVCLDESGHRHHERLLKLHAQALGLYMIRRINGQDGAVQKARLERIGAAINEYT